MNLPVANYQLIALVIVVTATTPAALAQECQSLPSTGDPCPPGYYLSECHGCGPCDLVCVLDGFVLPPTAYDCPPGIINTPIVPLNPGFGHGGCLDCPGPCVVYGTITSRCLEINPKDPTDVTCILELGTVATLLNGITPCPTDDAEVSTPAICPTTTAGYEFLESDPSCIRITSPGKLVLYAITPSAGGFSTCACPVYWDEISYEIGDVCQGDLDGDGTVGFVDLNFLLENWQTCEMICETCCPGDVDGDGHVGFTDLATLLDAWGDCH